MAATVESGDVGRWEGRGEEGGETGGENLLKKLEEQNRYVLYSVSSKNGGGGGGVEHLETVYALCLGTSLYYYPVLREHGKKGVLHPLPPFVRNTAVLVDTGDLFVHQISN